MTARRLVETRSQKADAGVDPQASASLPTGPARLCLVGSKVNRALRDEIDAYATAHGVSRSKAVAEYLAIARETLQERDGVPAGRADEILDALEGIRSVIEVIGPPVLAVLRLLAHWASQTDLKVSEDELLAELRAVAADEWEQAVQQAERSLQRGAVVDLNERSE